MKARSFTDMIVWKRGHRLVLDVYKIVNSFPSAERYGLKAQLCRAAVSLTSNIAEGFCRDSYKDKLRFYYMSRGSVAEIQNQLLVARDLEFLAREDFKVLANQTIVIQKLLNALIKSSKARI